MSNTLFDALFKPHAGSDKTFIELADGTVISYKSFLDTAATFANVLVKNGVKPNDRVAVQVEKSPEALAVYAACIQAGAVFLPLNTAYTANEIAYFIGDAEAALMLCDDKDKESLQPIVDNIDATLLTLNGDGTGSLSAKAKEETPVFTTVDRGDDDLAAFLYTSGTTGRSKGAMLSHMNLLSNCRVLAEYWSFSEDDVLLHALPIFHTHGLFVATNVTLIAGSSLIFLPRFDQDIMVNKLKQATVMMGVPTFYTRLLDDARLNKELVSKVRLFVSGSAPLLADTHVAFEQRTGYRILERYGMTETNMITSNPYNGERKAGTVGFPLPGVEVRICEPDTSSPLAQGEVGIIEVRGPNVFKGYWNMPEKTKEELREDGFFITGDLGLIDDDGYVNIVGRSKDLIISGGYNIYPKEVELLLDEQEGVSESAVIGVPHPDFGEAVVGVIVPENGAKLDEKSILETIRGQVARFKQPKCLFFINELPRNTMGKVQKNILRDEYSKVFSNEFD